MLGSWEIGYVSFQHNSYILVCGQNGNIVWEKDLELLCEVTISSCSPFRHPLNMNNLLNS